MYIIIIALILKLAHFSFIILKTLAVNMSNKKTLQQEEDEDSK